MSDERLENFSILGPAAVDAATLTNIAALALRDPTAELRSARAQEIGYPVFNMTTGGLWRVEGTAWCRGEAGQPRQSRNFGAVVKVIQSPLLWSGIGQIPEYTWDDLLRYYPWRTEADVYVSDLAEAMPKGGRLPAIYHVDELDGQRVAIWMEDVPSAPDAMWGDARFQDAATLLGRLAGSNDVRQKGPEISATRDADRLRYYLNGFVSMVLIPGIRGDQMWQIPAVAEVADRPLIAGLRSLADRAPGLVEEILALPILPAHGDASPQNLLRHDTSAGSAESSEFVVIDWGLYGGACIGFDLGQLLAGWVNQGIMSGKELYRLEPLCLRAYCEGLAESGYDGHASDGALEATVRRGHAGSMALFAGLQAVGTQRLAEPDSDELRNFVAGRVEMARFVVELVASTEK